MINKKRLDPYYQEWRNIVLQRDNYTCQMPNCESKRNLIVHHIKPYAKSIALRTDPNNGITLCRKCHKCTFGKETTYAHIFLSIINQYGVSDVSRKSRN